MTLFTPLRRQILIALIAIGIIPLAIAGAILIMLDRQALSTQSARELTGLARGFGAEVDLYMSSRMNDTRAIASLPLPIQGLMPP